MAEKAKILIVDDEKEVVAFLKQILQRAIECDVEESYDGEEAISLMKNNDFDLVILDIKMPKISGFDVLKKVKQHKKLPDVLILTGWDSGEITNTAVKEGALDYMPKPLSADLLLVKIKHILEKKGKYFEIGKSN